MNTEGDIALNKTKGLDKHFLSYFEIVISFFSSILFIVFISMLSSQRSPMNEMVLIPFCSLHTSPFPSQLTLSSLDLYALTVLLDVSDIQSNEHSDSRKVHFLQWHQ